MWRPRLWLWPDCWNEDRKLIFNNLIILPPFQSLEGWRDRDLGQTSEKAPGKGCGRQAVTGHDVGAQKGVVSLSREVIFAELGKVDTHLSEMLQRQNRVQRLSEGWEV